MPRRTGKGKEGRESERDWIEKHPFPKQIPGYGVANNSPEAEAAADDEALGSLS